MHHGEQIGSKCETQGILQLVGQLNACGGIQGHSSNTKPKMRAKTRSWDDRRQWMVMGKLLENGRSGVVNLTMSLSVSIAAAPLAYLIP
jgi:hypothetical protein